MKVLLFENINDKEVIDIIKRMTREVNISYESTMYD